MYKRYIEEQYRSTWLDFETAKSGDEQWDARRRLHKLVNLAAQMYGFDYADSLRRLRSEVKDGGSAAEGNP